MLYAHAMRMVRNENRIVFTDGRPHRVGQFSEPLDTAAGDVTSRMTTAPGVPVLMISRDTGS